MNLCLKLKTLVRFGRTNRVLTTGHNKIIANLRLETHKPVIHNPVIFTNLCPNPSYPPEQVTLDVAMEPVFEIVTLKHVPPEDFRIMPLLAPYT